MAKKTVAKANLINAPTFFLLSDLHLVVFHRHALCIDTNQHNQLEYPKGLHFSNTRQR